MCLTDFIDWRCIHSWLVQSVMLVFSTPLVYCSPSTFSLTSPPPPRNRTVYTNSVWLGGGWGLGVLSCVVDHILQEINTLFLTRFRTYKIATPPKQKWPVITTFRDWYLKMKSTPHLEYILSYIRVRQLSRIDWQRMSAGKLLLC